MSSISFHQIKVAIMECLETNVIANFTRHVGGNVMKYLILTFCASTNDVFLLLSKLIELFVIVIFG